MSCLESCICGGLDWYVPQGGELCGALSPESTMDTLRDPWCSSLTSSGTLRHDGLLPEFLWQKGFLPLWRTRLPFSCTEPFCVLQWYLELIRCYLYNGEWAWVIKLLVFDLFAVSVNSKNSNDSSENKIKLLLYFTCFHNKMVILANICNGNSRYWNTSSAQGNSEIDFSCFPCFLAGGPRHF